MRDFIRKPKSWIGITVALSVLIALIISFVSSFKTNLPSYTDDGNTLDVYTEPTPEPTAPVETQLYQNVTMSFSMPVPADWTYVLQGGNDTYINKTDSSKITFVYNDYTPSIWSITAETSSANITAQDGILGAFEWVDNAAYFAIYEIGAYDYFEYVTWDLNTIIVVTMQIPAQRYTYYVDSALYLFDRLQWQRANPLPDGYSMFYSEYGNFEFAVPDGWATGIENSAYVAQDPQTGAMFQVSLSTPATDLGSLTQLDYVNSMSGGKSGYMLSTYSNSGTILNAEASYRYDDVEYIELHNILASNGFWYEFLFQCPSDYIGSVGEVYLTVTRYFRVF